MNRILPWSVEDAHDANRIGHRTFALPPRGVLFNFENRNTMFVRKTWKNSKNEFAPPIYPLVTLARERHSYGSQSYRTGR